MLDPIYLLSSSEDLEILGSMVYNIRKKNDGENFLLI